MDSTYKIANNNIHSETFGDDLVALNLATGQYFGFNLCAALIWRSMIVHQASPEAMKMAGFSNQYLHAAISRLEELGLIAASSEPPQPLPSDLQNQLGLTWPAPEIELYDDLSALMLADPIHDVEGEAGWPNVTPSNSD